MGVAISESLKLLRTEVQTMANQAKTMYTELEAKGDARTGEDVAKLDALINEGEKKRTEMERLEKMVKMDELSITANFGDGESGQQVKDTGPAAFAYKSIGSRVIESKEFKERGANQDLPRTLIGPMVGNIKAGIYSTTQTVATGILADNQYQPDVIDIARQRPLTILDLINISPTSTAAIEYVLMASRTNAAAVVPEYSAGAYGLKPQGDLTFDLKVAVVKTIATWIAASRQILDDAPRLRAMIDSELMYMVAVVLEDQVLTGDGTSNNFLGILNTSGIQTRVMSATAPTGRGQTTADTKLDTLRRSITDIRLAFYQPDGTVISPQDGEALELAKDSQGRYLMIYDPVMMRLWRVPCVESFAMPAGTAVTGAWKLGATLWDRQQAEVFTGQPNDFFLRNAFAILAELRAAFAVVRPQAFEKVTLI